MNMPQFFLYLYGVFAIIVSIGMEYKIITIFNQYGLDLIDVIIYQILILVCFCYGIVVLIIGTKCGET